MEEINTGEKTRSMCLYCDDICLSFYVYQPFEYLSLRRIKSESEFLRVIVGLTRMSLNNPSFQGLVLIVGT